MAVLPILRWPAPRLSQVCEKIGTIDAEITRLAEDMLETMYAAPGRGLAAPQVGLLRRIFVMDIGWKDGAPAPMVLINPEIQWHSDNVETGDEGCLSIPGVTAGVARPAEVRMCWTDLSGKAVIETLPGFAARCAQHELDHLDGLVTFDRVPPEQRAALEAAYSP